MINQRRREEIGLRSFTVFEKKKLSDVLHFNRFKCTKVSSILRLQFDQSSEAVVDLL